MTTDAITRCEAARVNPPSDPLAEAHSKAVTDCELLASKLDQALDQLRLTGDHCGSVLAIDWQMSVGEQIEALIKAMA